MAALKLVCALVLCMLVVEPMATSAISCADVTKQTTPCIQYLQNGRNLPSSCCAGVKALKTMAKTSRDRQTICRCLQNAAKYISGLKPNLAEGLPGKCGVKVSIKISTFINCNRLK